MLQGPFRQLMLGAVELLNSLDASQKRLTGLPGMFVIHRSIACLLITLVGAGVEVPDPGNTSKTSVVMLLISGDLVGESVLLMAMVKLDAF